MHAKHTAIQFGLLDQGKEGGHAPKPSCMNLLFMS